jgi:DNA-binding helix-hairpin-helix protein with protein kinase domain
MTSALRLDDGVRVDLGPVIARAGEGTIYGVVGRDDWAVKVFHPDLKELHVKRAKVAAMTASPPAGVKQSDGFIVLTWPLQSIDDAEIGYIMPRVDTSNAVEIHTISNPSNRANPLPSAPQWTKHASWEHLVNVAANLCLAVDTVHRTDAVIGDFQERNILVNDTTRVTLVDCDSMQFTGGRGHHYLCGVGRPEFTAPELAGVDLSSSVREKPSDLFALAVHIHLLLMAGNHPFLRGDWTGGGDQPDALTLAKSGQWAGGPDSKLHRHPLAPPVSFLPPEIFGLFVRAFTEGARDPTSRPTAAEWRQALQKVKVTDCARGHQVPTATEQCPWCGIEDERSARRRQRESTVGPDQVIFRAAAPPAPPRASSQAQRRPITSSTLGAPAGRNRNLILGGILGLAAVVAIIIVIVIGLNGSNTSAASSTETSSAETTAATDAPLTSVAGTGGTPPVDAVECPGVAGGPYGHAATGSTLTSCPFAVNVADAVNGSSLRFPATLQVFSPVTQQNYDMQCAVEQVLTCRGGDDAVVYVY